MYFYNSDDFSPPYIFHLPNSLPLIQNSGCSPGTPVYLTPQEGDDHLANGEGRGRA